MNWKDITKLQKCSFSLEEWLSGLKQQFTKLSYRKVPGVRIPIPLQCNDS